MAGSLPTTLCFATLATGCFVDFGELQPGGGGCPPDAGTAEWHFDEGAGQTAQNALSSCYAITLGANDAPEAGDPTWTSDARACSGSALAFDGVDDRAVVDVHIGPSFTFDFCVFLEAMQPFIYPRLVSTEEATFDGFYVNFNIGSQVTLETRLPSTDNPAQSESDYGLFPSGRSCWRIVYDDGSDRTLHILQATGGSYVEVSAYAKQFPLQGEVHINDVPMLFGIRQDGDSALFGVLDEVRLFAGVSTTPPPSCTTP